MLINLQKRGTNKPSNVVIRGVTPAGLTLRPQVELVEGRDVPPGDLGSDRGARDRQRLSGRRRRRDAAFRVARLDGRRGVRRGPHGVRLGDLGRRRADAAGVPSSRLLGGDLQTRRHRSIRRGEEGARVRSAAHGRGQARDPLLRRPVGSAVEVHQLPRHDDLGDLLGRRDHRRDDHDVRERRLAHRRRSARCARSAFPAERSSRRSWSRRCCWASSEESSGSPPRPPCRRSRSRR